jgi:ubiquinone/menaquinone biosynthesis C-methylase UbiE
MDDAAVNSMILSEDLHPWYQARKSIVESWLQSERIGKIGLDLGSGSGAISELLYKNHHREMIAIDASELCISATKSRGIPAFIMDAQDLTFEDSTFDFVVSLDVLEHVTDPLAMLREVCRVLKPNGQFLFTVPAHMFLWSNHDIINHHRIRYSKYSLRRDFSMEPNLVVKNLRYWNSILLPIFILRRIFDNIARSKYQPSSNEFDLPPRFLRKFLTMLLKWEAGNRCIGRFIGVSIIISGQKFDLR